MRLQEKLDDMRKQFESSAPPEALSVMHRATDDLRSSGILEGVLKAGDQAPGFTLPDAQGNEVPSLTMLGKGPLVVSFYRGIW